MTKGRVVLRFDIGYWERRDSRSLHFASVGKTLLFGGWSLEGRFGRSEGRTADPSATPDFLSESCGFGQLPVVLFRENHISGRQSEQ
jgi:hypothetical protein